MNTNEDLKHFNDPLFEGLRDSKKEDRDVQTKTVRGAREKTRKTGVILGIVALAALAGVLVYLREAQARITLLSGDLAANQERLQQVTNSLEQSRSQLQGLSDGLQHSQAQLHLQRREITRYRGLYDTLKGEHAEQTKELKVIAREKADRTEVIELKEDTGQLREQVDRADQSIGELYDQTTQNRGQIQQTQAAVAEVEESVAANANEIDSVKRSLEREYYNFELQKKGGYMKVFSVALSLKDTDWKKRQFDLYLLADGKVIQKKDHAVNEPILFYVDGQSKPFEVVVTRVDKELVVGYLSVPRG